MYFEVFNPPYILKPYVHSIQVMEYRRNENMMKQKIVPYGFAGILFHYKDSYIQTDAINGTKQLPKAFVSGLTDLPITIDALGDTGTIAVNLYPLGLYHFAKNPADDFTNNSIDLFDLLGNKINNLLDALTNTPNIQMKVSIVNRFLIDELNISILKKNAKIEYVQNKLITSGGNINIVALAKEFGLSVSSLERNFRKQAGFTPKHYARIMRFNQVFRLLNRHESLSWQDIVFKCGYYDQAHLIKEFSKFSGETPQKYFAQDHLSGTFYSGK